MSVALANGFSIAEPNCLCFKGALRALHTQIPVLAEDLPLALLTVALEAMEWSIGLELKRLGRQLLTLGDCRDALASPLTIFSVQSASGSGAKLP